MLEGTRSYIYVGDDPIDHTDPSGLMDAAPASAVGTVSASTSDQATVTFRGFVPPNALFIGAYNFVVGDDLATLQSNQPAWAKGLALIDLGANLTLVIPGVGEGVAGLRFAAKGAATGVVKGVLLSGGRAVVGDVSRATIERLSRTRGLRWLARTVAKCGACFPAGTQVATPAGVVAINQLRVGDPVLAEDPRTGTVEAEPVQAVIVHPVWPLMAVDLSDGSTITVTVEHPFWVDLGIVRLGLGGWVLAGQLHTGDRLRTARGAQVQVVGLRYHVGRAAVYTLTVAKDHTFFVGSVRVLVHNSLCLYLGKRLAPNWPKDFERAQDGLRKVNINDHVLLEQLQEQEPGKWVKVYEDGWSQGEQISVHYFQHASGKVFDLEVHLGWSNRASQ